MRVRDWQEILNDVIESGADPEGWRAVAGDRARGLGEDMYLGHADVGLFHFKTYAKNPFNVQGVGTRVARRIDDEIGSYLPTETDSRFAVQQSPGDESEARTKARRLEETLKTHAAAPTTPDDLFVDIMDAIESPAFGPLDYGPRNRPENLSKLSTTFEDAEKILDAELEDLIEEDGINRGFL